MSQFLLREISPVKPGDVNCARLDAALESIQLPATALVADLAGVEFCDAAGLRALLAAQARCAARAATLRVVPSDAVARVTDLAGLGGTLSVYPDRRHVPLDRAAE